MSLQASKWAWGQCLTATQKLILLALSDRANDNGVCYPSVSRIEKDTCLNRKTVLNGLSKLEELNLLTIKKNNGSSNYYTLNLSNTSTKIGTGTNINTSTKNGTEPVPKTVPDQYQNRDTNLPLIYKEPIKKKIPSFKRPSIDDITEFINEQSYSVNPTTFFNYYESNGWKVGKNSMKNWKAAIRTWETKEKSNERNQNFNGKRKQSNLAWLSARIQEDIKNEM